jgi:hypothetical protein
VFKKSNRSKGSLLLEMFPHPLTSYAAFGSHWEPEALHMIRGTLRTRILATCGYCFDFGLNCEPGILSIVIRNLMVQQHSLGVTVGVVGVDWGLASAVPQAVTP